MKKKIFKTVFFAVLLLFVIQVVYPSFSSLSKAKVENNKELEGKNQSEKNLELEKEESKISNWDFDFNLFSIFRSLFRRNIYSYIDIQSNSILAVIDCPPEI